MSSFKEINGVLVDEKSAILNSVLEWLDKNDIEDFKKKYGIELDNPIRVMDSSVPQHWGQNENMPNCHCFYGLYNFHLMPLPGMCGCAVLVGLCDSNLDLAKIFAKAMGYTTIQYTGTACNKNTEKFIKKSFVNKRTDNECYIFIEDL